MTDKKRDLEAIPETVTTPEPIKQDPAIDNITRLTGQQILHARNPETKDRFSETTLSEAGVLEKILEVENGFLPPKHPVTQYLNERIRHLFPVEPLTVKVAINEDEPNALSLSNGTIVITKGLLRLLETREELDFALAHEGVHFIEGHTQEINDAINKTKERFQDQDVSIGQMLTILGSQRISEYEADIKGVMKMAEGKINPAAARSVFLKFQEYDESQSRGGRIRSNTRGGHQCTSALHSRDMQKNA